MSEETLQTNPASVHTVDVPVTTEPVDGSATPGSPDHPQTQFSTLQRQGVRFPGRNKMKAWRTNPSGSRPSNRVIKNVMQRIPDQNITPPMMQGLLKRAGVFDPTPLTDAFFKAPPVEVNLTENTVPDTIEQSNQNVEVVNEAN